MKNNNNLMGGLDKKKAYWKEKYTGIILDFICTIFIILFFRISGLSFKLAQIYSDLFDSQFLIIFFYLLSIFIFYFLFSTPLDIIFDFILEKKFGFSKLKFGSWFYEKLKINLVLFAILFVFVEFFYYFLDDKMGWLKLSIFWIGFSFIFNWIMPILLVPLFFKYKNIFDQDLRERIFNLAKKMNINILDVYEIDFSRKTTKANAGLLGLGKTKRVVLADTLNKNYSQEEIEAILAHEFSHYKLKHHIKSFVLLSLLSSISFYFMFKIFSIEFLAEISNLPIIFLYFLLFTALIRPFLNFISRQMERNADKLAVSYIQSKSSFVSMLEKLSQQNLSDTEPSLIAKIIFFDHPPIKERINNLKSNIF